MSIISDSFYTIVDKDFYHDQTISINPLRRWFHVNRYRIGNSLVKSKYERGKKILDMGCGSCDWNVDRLDVYGVDLNENLLKLSKEKNRIFDYKVVDCTETSLPAESFDIVTSFEFLEHLENYQDAIKEGHRLLKKGGYFIISVPFDTVFSLWKPLFFLQVLYHGYILQNDYYKQRCGHVNHFSKESIKASFLIQGFEIETLFVMRGFTIFLCAKKMSVADNGSEYSDMTIIFPTLNEENNISSIIETVISNYKKCRIIITDDGSSDRTKEVVEKIKYDDLYFIDRSHRRIHGITASVLDAIRLVKTKYFIVLDADGQHPISKVRDIVNILRLGGKLVIACRVEVEQRWSLFRKFISFCGSALGKITLILKGKNYISYDVTGGFFGCNLKFWKGIKSDQFKTMHFRLKGYKILYDFLKYAPSRLPIDEVYYRFETRKAEVSKINPKIYMEFLKSCLLP